MRGCFRVGVLVLAFVILAGTLFWGAAHWKPDAAAYPVQGVDVSEENGIVAWPTVEAAGADFAYIKATEGADSADPNFAENWEKADAAGLRRGAYHVYSLCRPALDQATNFISIVERDQTALPAAVKLTLSGNCDDRPERAQVLRDLTRFIQMVEAHTGKTIILGLSRDFERNYEISSAIDRPLWLTGFFLRPSYASRDWAMWQASTFRRVKGIQGSANWNVIQQ